MLMTFRDSSRFVRSLSHFFLLRSASPPLLPFSPSHLLTFSPSHPAPSAPPLPLLAALLTPPSSNPAVSGPAGGVVGFALTSWEKGGAPIIGLDMGGTSTDVSRFAGEFEVRRLLPSPSLPRFLRPLTRHGTDSC